MSYMRIGWPLTYFKSGATGMYVYDDGYCINGGQDIGYADKKSVCELLTDVILRQTEDPNFARATLFRLAKEMKVADDLKPRIRFSPYYSPQMKKFREMYNGRYDEYGEVSDKLPEWRVALSIISDRMYEQIDNDLYDTDISLMDWSDEREHFQCQGCDFIGTEDQFERVPCKKQMVGNKFRDGTTLKCKCGYEAHSMW